MIKEGLEYLFGKTQAHIHTIDNLPYSDKGITLVVPPQPPTVGVDTLNAFATLSDSEVDGAVPEDCFVQVENYHTVSLQILKADSFGRRRKYISAHISESAPFQFGRFMEPESFVIALQSLFVDTAPLKNLISLASSLTAENVAVAEDDGISQTATFRSGIALKSNKKIEPKIDLRPFRTFREIQQPESTFLFRLRSRDNQAPECALFEADGGAWKLVAVKSIFDWLKTHLPVELKNSVVF